MHSKRAVASPKHSAPWKVSSDIFRLNPSRRTAPRKRIRSVLESATILHHLNLLAAGSGYSNAVLCARQSASTDTKTTQVLPPSAPDRTPDVGNRAAAQSPKRRQRRLASVCHGTSDALH